MLGKLYDREACSAARALEVVGERWSLLIVRDALFAGSSRFKDFENGLGIAPNVLTARLNHLVEAGVFETAKDARGVRSYRLTTSGQDLAPVIVALTQWGDRWRSAEAGPPVRYRHAVCGADVSEQVRCERCGGPVRPEHISAEVSAWAREWKQRSAIGSSG